MTMSTTASHSKSVHRRGACGVLCHFPKAICAAFVATVTGRLPYHGGTRAPARITRAADDHRS